MQIIRHPLLKQLYLKLKSNSVNKGVITPFDHFFFFYSLISRTINIQFIFPFSKLNEQVYYWFKCVFVFFHLVVIGKYLLWMRLILIIIIKNNFFGDYHA